MNFGKLLLSGSSLGDARNAGGRFRVRKHVHLPKFISPRNPFASEPAVPVTVEPVATAAVAEPVVLLVAPEPVRLTDLTTSGGEPALRNFFSAEKLGGMVIGAAEVTRVVAVRAWGAARWVGVWGRKLNPLPRLLRRNKTPSAADIFRRPAVQTELSLDAVKVLRNDLSDADLEVVLVTKPVAPDQTEQLIMASAGAREKSGAFNRMSSWMFGAKPS